MDPNNLTKEDLKTTIAALDGLKNIILPAMNKAGYKNVDKKAVEKFTSVLGVAKLACAHMLCEIEGDTDAEACV
ncbi:MAG: hypothetical protein EOM54_05700 [Clostridia bacterium]|nr:hypothetical protein [Clostridia bacterium]